MDNDQNDHRTEEEKQDAGSQAKRDKKMKKKLVDDLGKVKKDLTGDREKAQERKNESAAEDAADAAAAAEMEEKKKRINEWEHERKAADNDQTK